MELFLYPTIGGVIYVGFPAAIRWLSPSAMGIASSMSIARISAAMPWRPARAVT